MSNKMFGKDNPMWKGDQVGMAALHDWVASRMPKPEFCNECKKERPRDLANKGIYDRNLDNWEWLCRRCHMTKDGRMNNLWKGVEDKRKWKPPKPRYGEDHHNWKGGIRASKHYTKYRYWKWRLATLEAVALLSCSALSDKDWWP
jgi:hypothetical protein